MTRICPQCHLELQDRSKFCPGCGARMPEAAATSASPVALGNETVKIVPPAPERPPSAPPPKPMPKPMPKTVAEGAHAQPAPARRVYAPATHALIGFFEQAGFGLRFGALLFDLLFTMIGWMA